MQNLLGPKLHCGTPLSAEFNCAARRWNGVSAGTEAVGAIAMTSALRNGGAERGKTALRGRDQHHAWAPAHFEAGAEPFVTCEAVISESFFLLERAPKH